MNRNLAHKAAALGGILLSMASLPAIPGCGDSRTEAQDLKPPVAQNWSDLGQGVFTFEFSDFPGNLVEFRKKHPDLVVTSMYADKEGGYGATRSVVITTESKDLFGWQVPQAEN